MEISKEELYRREKTIKPLVKGSFLGFDIFFWARPADINSSFDTLRPLTPAHVKKVGEFNMIFQPSGYGGEKFVDFTKAAILKNLPYEQIGQFDAYSATIDRAVIDGCVVRVNPLSLGLNFSEPLSYIGRISLFKAKKEPEKVFDQPVIDNKIIDPTIYVPPFQEFDKGLAK